MAWTESLAPTGTLRAAAGVGGIRPSARRVFPGVGEYRSADEELKAIAAHLSRELRRDVGLQAATARLWRLGASLVIRIGLEAGENPARVVTDRPGGVVAQWTDEDRCILASLGITGESGES